MRKLFTAAAATLLSLSAQASDEKWIPGNSNFVSVHWGEPDSDNISFIAECARKGMVVVTLMIGDKSLTKTKVSGEPSLGEVKIGTDRFYLIGKWTKDEGGYFTVPLTPDSPFLKRLANDERSTLKAGSLSIGLDKVSSSNFKRILKRCE
uniref:Uncharacterized protein n=1 Tax=Bosea sp. NBC_00436 TaxID=2969620 RepID=A0A9E8CIS6_9HYPH